METTRHWFRWISGLAVDLLGKDWFRKIFVAFIAKTRDTNKTLRKENV